MNVSLQSRWPYVHVDRNERATSTMIGWSFLTMNIFVTATYTIFAKMLTGVLSPMSLLFLSELLTIFFTLFFFGVVPSIRHLLRMKKGQWIPALVIGLTNGIIGPLLWFTGLGFTSAVNATLFSNAEMMFLAVFAITVFKEDWNKWYIVSVGAILCGIIVTSIDGFHLSMQIQGGDFLLLLASLSFSIGSVVHRKYLQHMDPEPVILIRSVTPVIAFFLISPFLHTTLMNEVQLMPSALIVILLGFGFISRFLNTFSFYEALDRLPVSTVSLLGNLTVVLTIIFAHFGLKEPIEQYHIIGGGLIILGSVLLEFAGVHPTEAHQETQLTERKTSRA